ncbi:TOBE domain-containing protein, partial [Roseomonas mucosa]|uniref:TOBE domain-containing protein n=1 Tax=Roseomonas mucosa TaxID=207340 RepID=UPI001EF71A2C
HHPHPVGAAEAFLRPHRVRVMPAGPTPEGAVLLEGHVLRRTYSGEIVWLEAETPAGPVQAELPAYDPGAALRVGDAVRLALRPEDLRVFPA